MSRHSDIYLGDSNITRNLKRGYVINAGKTYEHNRRVIEKAASKYMEDFAGPKIVKRII